MDKKGLKFTSIKKYFTGLKKEISTHNTHHSKNLSGWGKINKIRVHVTTSNPQTPQRVREADVIKFQTNYLNIKL